MARAIADERRAGLAARQAAVQASGQPARQTSGQPARQASGQPAGHPGEAEEREAAWAEAQRGVASLRSELAEVENRLDEARRYRELVAARLRRAAAREALGRAREAADMGRADLPALSATAQAEARADLAPPATPPGESGQPPVSDLGALEGALHILESALGREAAVAVPDPEEAALALEAAGWRRDAAGETGLLLTSPGGQRLLLLGRA